MTYFRRHHQQYCIKHNENTTYFWQSYYGGRTEAFYIGKCHGIVYDVKSMYPYIMKTIKFPNPKFLKIEKNVPIKNIEKYLFNYEGCIFANVEHTPNWLGLLPIKKGGKLLFPIGNI